MYPNQFAPRHTPESQHSLATKSKAKEQQPHQPNTCQSRNGYEILKNKREEQKLKE